MIISKNCTGILLALIMPAALFAAVPQQKPEQHQDHQSHQRGEGVNSRGDHAMGFSHERTTHHFRLSIDGGSIEVTANDPQDAASQEQIKSHLSHIAKLFKEGDFSKPLFIHGETPPGVATMKRLKTDISYTFEEIEHGSRVRIASENPEAVNAVHEFLRYQIRDHKTGDPLEPAKQAAGNKQE